MTNWKTTLAGISAIVASIAVILKAISDGNSDVAITAGLAIITGIGHLLAKDHSS